MIGLTMRSVTWNRFPIKNLWWIPCFFHLWGKVSMQVMYHLCSKNTLTSKH